MYKVKNQTEESEINFIFSNFFSLSKLFNNFKPNFSPSQNLKNSIWVGYVLRKKIYNPVSILSYSIFHIPSSEIR